MKIAAILCTIVLTLTAPSGAAAQTGIRPPQGWSLGLMGGAAAFSDMQRGSLEVVRVTAAGPESRDFRRRVGAKTSTVVGAYLSFWPSRNWGLRINGTFTPTRFETIMRADAAVSDAEEERLAGLGVTTAELQALFRLPTIKNRVLLYGLIGGGVARYDVGSADEPLPLEAAEDFEDGYRVEPGGMFGLGAMLPFRNRAFRLHFELTDHVTRTPIPPDVPSDQDAVEVTSTVRFTVGASWSPKH